VNQGDPSVEGVEAALSPVEVAEAVEAALYPVEAAGAVLFPVEAALYPVEAAGPVYQAEKYLAAWEV
jgi:hypothetical protein